MVEKPWKNCFFNSILRGKGKTFIDSFLNTERDVNVLKTDGHTALSNAAEFGYLEIVEYLAQKGADINIKNADGSGPLHIAAKYGNEDIVKFFYRNKCDLNVRTSDGSTPLLLAAKYGHKVVAKFLISSGADVECCNNDDKWTVLHYACRAGWLDIVQSFVNKQCNLNVVSCGRTPLLVAAVYQKRKVVALLILSGADVECCNNDDKWTVLHYACHQGWLDIVQCLVNKKCNLNVKTIDGLTPLLLAKSATRTDLIVLLVESGVDVDQCIPHFKGTIFHYASSVQWSDVVKALIKSNADLNVANSEGDTPLHIACKKKALEIMKQLLEAGAKWNVKNHYKMTALSYCTNITSSVEAIKLFFENGAYFEFSGLLIMNVLHKNPILQDVELCTQSVINKFNNKDLPAFYELYGCGERLPTIEKLKISHGQNVTREIEKSVENDVSTTGYFNLREACPMVLKMLSVKALIDYYQLKLKNFPKIRKRQNGNESKIKKRRLN